mgnify:CR=1 FL=1
MEQLCKQNTADTEFIILKGVILSITPFFHVYHKYVFNMANINKIKLSGTTYSIQDENATKTVELTQAQYDALAVKDPNTFYIITDSEGVDLSNYYTKSETSGATQISTALASKADTATTYTKTEVDNAVTAATSTKQDTLVSGTNIKTINNESILGSGNITIEGGGGSSYTAGDGIDITNDVISVTGKVDTSAFTAHTADTVIHVTSAEKTAWNAKSDFSGDYNDLTNKPTIPTVPTSNTAFTNDAGYITIDAISGKVDTSTYNTYTAATDTAIAGKQDNLVSGTNIKTINNESILGEGNITIEGGGGKAVSAGTNISITTGETADTINCTLPITASTYSNASKIIIDNNYSFISNDAVISGKNDATYTSKSIVLGINTLLADGSGANIEYNLAFGERNNVTASGIYKASASQNFILGSNNSIYNASKCFALGTANNLKKNHQFVVGDYNTVLNEYETLFGRYNVSSSASTTFGNSGNTLFSVGNGTSDSARHNAFEIKQNGDIYIPDTNDTSTTNYYEKPMIKLQDALGGGSSYTAGDGIDITNDVISVTGKTDSSAFTAYTAATNSRLSEDEEVTAAALNNINDRLSEDEEVTAAGLNAVNDKFDGLKLKKLTQAEYDALTTKDSNTLYIVI